MQSSLLAMEALIPVEWQLYDKNNLDCTTHHIVLDPMGRYVILKADVEDTTYLLINVYAPNKDKDLLEFFKILNTLKKENLDSEENIVMGGDFNFPLNPAIDKKRRHT